MDNEKLIEILRDKEFAKKILVMETAEEVQNAFKEKGVEISLEEIGALGTAINKIIEKGEKSLSEDELGGISGGHVGYNAVSFLAGLYEGAVSSDDPSVKMGIDIMANASKYLEALPEETKIIKTKHFNHTLDKSDAILMGAGFAIGSVPGHARCAVQKVIKWAKK